jgi:hypothetical protein
MVYLPNDLTKDIRELGLFYRADTKRFWWKKITICLPFVGMWCYNPVRAKIVKDPGDWKWSTYRATIGY